MISEDQLRKIISANESLQVQLDDANAVLAAREQEIDYLHNELSEAAALRSKLEGQMNEIESIQEQIYKKDQQAVGAIEREIELQHELTDYAKLNKEYNELIQDYAYLQSRFKDIQAQLTTLDARNFELEQVAGKVGELESMLGIIMLERDELKSRITELESQKYLREFNL